MTNEARKRLLDAISACEAISEFVAGKDFSAYENDRLLRSAVERQFEIIGEALNKAGAVETSLPVQIPEFHRITGLRNRLIHGYDNVDDEILWDVVQSKLGPLKARMEAALRDAEKADR
ncbi:DUF86 domain-containing protein [soil metagenome]